MNDSWLSGYMQYFTHAVGFDGRSASPRVDVHAMDVQPLTGFGRDVFIVAGRKGVVVDNCEGARGCSQNGFQGQVGQRGALTLFGGISVEDPRGTGEERVAPFRRVVGNGKD